MPDPTPGRSLVTRRVLRDLVRNATLGVYGVSDVRSHGPAGRLVDRLGIGRGGVSLHGVDGLDMDLHVVVASSTAASPTIGT